MARKKVRKTLRVAILTAVPLEFLAVKERLSNVRENQNEGSIYNVGTFKGFYHDYRVLVAEVGIGNANAAVGTDRAVSYFKPEIVLFVGIAGAIKDLRLGDVVVGDKVYGYEYAKATDGKLLTRPELGRSSWAILGRARADAMGREWQNRIRKSKGRKTTAIVKPIAAGEQVISSSRSDVYKLIKSNYNDAVAVDMEGNGFFVALQKHHKLEALVVRGVSDQLNKKEQTDSRGYQEIGADHACAFAFEVLFKFKLN